MWPRRGVQYAPLGQPSDAEYRKPAEDGRKSHVFAVLCAVSACLVGIAIGFVLGQREGLGAESASEGGGPVLRDLPRAPLQYNESFVGRPNEETSAAWESLFPQGPHGGFFTDSMLTDGKPAVVSALHQVHCLELMWRHFWTIYDIAADLNQTVSQQNVATTSPPEVRSHMRTHHLQNPWKTHHLDHCFELVRTTLMCKPDLTIAVQDETKGGVTGFLTEHQCQNWDDLLAWTARMQQGEE